MNRCVFHRWQFRLRAHARNFDPYSIAWMYAQ